MAIRSKYPTLQSFCARFSPQNATVGAQQPTKCVTCSAPTLTDIALSYGTGSAIIWLGTMLTYFQERISVPNKMSAYELESCAQTFCDSFHYLKTTEIMLFLVRLSGGMYPVDWHGYVTPTKIISALRDHFMPWRNELLHKIERQERERRLEEEAKQPGITWEEYCRIKGIDKPNPLTLLT